MRINITTLVAVCRHNQWREVEVDHHLTLPEGMNGLEVEAAAERAAVDVAKREGGTMVWSHWIFDTASLAANAVLSGCPPEDQQERGSPSGQSA